MQGLWDHLNPLEREIASLVEEDFENKEIAEQLKIPHTRVKAYLQNIFLVFGVMTALGRRGGP